MAVAFPGWFFPHDPVLHTTSAASRSIGAAQSHVIPWHDMNNALRSLKF
jgi:hypothetical protein